MVATLRRGALAALLACGLALPVAAQGDPDADMTRLKALQAAPIDDAGVRAALARDQLANPPYFLYELARRTLPLDEAAAARWFMVALARTRYDAMRCADPTAAGGVGLLGQIAREVAARLQDRAVRKRAVQEVLDRDDLFASKVPPIYICTHGMDTVIAGLEQRPIAPAAMIRPAAEWPAIAAQLRQQLAALAR